MVGPERYALSVYRGDTSRWRFVLWADAAKTVPANLTGVTVVAEIHQPGFWRGQRVPLAVTVTANQIDLVLAKSQSQQLLIVPSTWDLQLTYPSGDVQTVMRGTVLIRPDVSGANLGAAIVAA